VANPRITVEINGDSSGLHKELGKADQGVMGFASSLKGLAASLGVTFGVQQVLSFAGGLMRAADAAKDTADALGESLQNVVGLTRLGAQAGVEQDKVLNWLQRVKQAQEEVIATNGTGATSKLLSGLGVNLTDFANAGPAKGLEMIVRAAGDAGDGIRVLNTVLGRLSSVDVKDALGKLATDGIDAIGKSAEKAASNVSKLAEQQNRLQTASAGTKEVATGLLASFFERAEMVNKGMGLSKGNLIGLIMANLPVTQIIQGIGAVKSGTSPADGNVNQVGNPVAITGISPEEQAARKKKFLEDDYNKALRDVEQRNALRDKYFADRDAKNYESVISGTDLSTLKGIQADQKGRVEGWLGSADGLEKELSILKMVTAEIEKQETAAKDKANRNAGIVRDGESRRQDIIERGRSAVDDIRVNMPRLSGIESLGAVLGGTGGAARSQAERQVKILEIHTDTLKAIKENTKQTAERLEE
jgi:hypothetical protein